MGAVRASFAVFGLFWGVWAVAALDVQVFLRFSDGGLGLLLAATVLGGALANAAGGVLAERHGTRAILTAALLTWAALLLATAMLTNRAAFCAAFLAMVGIGGLVDVTMNVAGTAALGSSSTQLLRLHALYNGGAVAGAAVAGILLDAGISFRWLWAGLAVAALATAAWCWRSEVPAGERGEHHTLRQAAGALRCAGLGTLAVVFAMGAMVEGGVGTWGVHFLRSQLGVLAVAGAVAYVGGQALATTARATLGWTAARIGERRGAQLGLGLAAVGLVVEATSSAAGPAAVGLAAAAVGVAVYWPLLLAHASQGSDRPGLVVGGLSAMGYVGFLAGPPLVGWVSDVVDPRWGLSMLALAAAVGALLPVRSVAGGALSPAAGSPAGGSAR